MDPGVIFEKWATSLGSLLPAIRGDLIGAAFLHQSG